MNFDESYGCKKMFQSETIIFEEGDPSDCMYIVVSGKIAIFKTVIHKATRTLHIVEANGCFGEMSLITGSKRTASAKVLEPTEVFQLEKNGLYKLLKNKPDFTINLMEQLSTRLQKTSENFIFSELELALSRYKPVRFDGTGSDKIHFEVVGTFSLDNKDEVTEIANKLTWPEEIDVIASFIKPGTNYSLVYVIATDNLHSVLNVTASFKNLANWQFFPVLPT